MSRLSAGTTGKSSGPSTGWYTEDLLLWIHMSSKVKDRWHLSQLIVWLYTPVPNKWQADQLNTYKIQWPHIPCHQLGKNKWSENSLFNVPNSMTIVMLLGILMAFISRSKAKGVVNGGIWVNTWTSEYWCILPPTPEASGLNIQMDIIGGVGRCKRKCLWSNWL